VNDLGDIAGPDVEVVLPGEESPGMAESPADPLDDGVDQTSNGESEREDSVEAGVEPPTRKRVFISHKRDVDINDELAKRLKTDLQQSCEDVYLDLDMLPGPNYEALIKEKLANADFVIAIISEAANGSNWLKTELRYANAHYQEKGTPIVLPIRLGFTDLYDPVIDVIIGQTQALSFDPINDKEKYNELVLEPLLFAITNQHYDRPRPDDRLSGFVVHQSRQERLRASFLEPERLAGARALLRDRKLLWIRGDAGVRNHVGLSLAIDQGRDRIYEISKPKSWSEINSSIISNATIIFQDPCPSTYFEESTPKAEFDSLRSLIKRNNSVLIAISEDAFQEIEPEMKKEAFEYDACWVVDDETYEEDDKLYIFRQLLELSSRHDALHPRQYELAVELLSPPNTHPRRHKTKVESRDKFLEIIRRCTPADIERFFTLHLRDVRSSTDFITLLQLNVGGDEEIRSWFVSLDDSVKCFVMTLALCSELDRKELWAKYKEIVKELKNLDPHLSLLPLGVCRQRAMPYVLPEGPIGFVNARVAEAINEEIARNYREYLIEILPRMKEWSVPARRGTDGNIEERKREAKERQAFREALARLIGAVGREEIDEEIADTLERWATDPILKVREAVAIALEQTAQDTSSANRSLDLLKKWGSGFAYDERSFLKLYAIASPLTRFASPKSGRAVFERAMSYLKVLSKDGRKGVRFYTSIAIRKMARKTELQHLEALLSALARDGDLGTRVNVAQAINEAREARYDNQEGAVSELTERWLSSADENLRWVAVCSLLTRSNHSRGRQPEAHQRQLDEIQSLLVHDAGTVASVLLEIISEERLKKNAWPFFWQLISDTSSRATLIGGLAKSDFSQLDKKLFDRLRRFGNPQHERLIVEIRKAYWERLLLTPSSFLTDLRKRLSEDKSVLEMFQALTELMRPEIEGGARHAVIAAMIAFYPQDRHILNEVLSKLRGLAPSIFGPISAEILRAALTKLFYDPPTFFQILLSDLENHDTSRDVYAALASLAQAEPLGLRKELLQALAYAHAVDSATVKPLLRLLRNSNSRVLSSLSYEFTYNLLEGKLATARDFVTTVNNALQDESEQGEMLNILQRFAIPEPGGKRRSLVRCLSTARSLDGTAVDQLVQHPLLKKRAGLAHLDLEVRVASVFSSVSRWFRPR
jgi:hypothetical protein